MTLLRFREVGELNPSIIVNPQRIVFMRNGQHPGNDHPSIGLLHKRCVRG